MTNLDTQQRQAVETESRSALVLAGAGSGKTRVLIERIAHLVEKNNVSPHEVMAFTFTRKAAQEIGSRLEDRLGKASYGVTLGTMHALALGMIKRFGEKLNLRPKHITVYCQWEEAFFLKDVAESIGVYKRNKKSGTWKIPKKEIDKMFQDYYQQGILPDENVKTKTLFDVFLARIRENNALTYGALLIGLELLIPYMAKYLHIRHILVDEVQDIDPLQWRIIRGLCDAFGASLFVVGDVSQSIYQWRGAVPEYLLEHEQEFDVYRIETNYRSDPQIVESANRLIEHNELRLPLTMKAARKHGEYSFVNTVHNMDSRGLARYIKSVTEPNSTNITVLARIHKLLDKLSEELTFEGVNHVKVGGQTALTNSENFRRLHAFLKLIVNPFDNFSFMLIKDIIGLLNIEYLHIRKTAVEQGESHFQAWMKSCDNVYTSFFKENSDGRLLKDVWGMHEFDGLTFDISEIGNFLVNWVNNNPNATIQDYLDWLVTYDLQDELDENHKGVQLMTVHASKGLEWPNVIIAGCNEGILPSKQAIAKGDIEAERRLFYTAITRAENQLIITVRPEQTTSENGKTYNNPISRFVKELEK